MMSMKESLAWIWSSLSFGSCGLGVICSRAPNAHIFSTVWFSVDTFFDSKAMLRIDVYGEDFETATSPNGVAPMTSIQFCIRYKTSSFVLGLTWEVDLIGLVIFYNYYHVNL